jgi:hypothetical protein
LVYYPGDASAAFLPAYPSAIHAVAAVVGGDALLAACLVSWASLAGALVALHALFREELGEDDSLLALVLLVAFPTAFFFHAAYTESFVAAIGGLLLAFAAVRRLRASHAVFALAGVVLPLMTPSRLQPLQSMPRFLVVLFPLFAVLALLLRGRPVLTACTVAAFAVLQGFFAARFALWFWVA